MLVGAGCPGCGRTTGRTGSSRAARWCPDQVGLALARLVVRLLVGDGQPVLVAVDDTLFHRTGKKVWAAGWFHDGSAKGRHQVGYGNNWVVVGVVVTLPVLDRPVCLPVLARLVRKDTTSGHPRPRAACCRCSRSSSLAPGGSPTSTTCCTTRPRLW